MKKIKNISTKLMKNPFILVLVLAILFYAGVATSYHSSGIAEERETKLAILAEATPVKVKESIANKEQQEAVLTKENNEVKHASESKSNKKASDKAVLKNKEDNNNLNTRVTPCTVKYKKHPAVYKTIKGASPVYEQQTWYVFIDGKVFYTIEDADSYSAATNMKYITWNKNVQIRPGEPDIKVLVKSAWVETIGCQ